MPGPETLRIQDSIRTITLDTARPIFGHTPEVIRLRAALDHMQALIPMNQLNCDRINDTTYSYDIQPTSGRVWQQDLHLGKDLSFEFTSITGVWFQEEVRAHMAVREAILSMVGLYGLTNARVKW